MLAVVPSWSYVRYANLIEVIMSDKEVLVVAELAEQLLPRLEDPGSNTAISNFNWALFMANFPEKAQINQRGTGNGPFKKHSLVKGGLVQKCTIIALAGLVLTCVLKVHQKSKKNLRTSIDQ